MKAKQLFALLLTLALLLTGCGSKSESTQAVYRAEAADNAAAEVVMESPAAGVELTQPENRKWIVTVEVYAETDDLDALLPALTEQIAQLQGYVEDQSVYNGSSNASRRYRNASLTIRVPAGDAEGFTQAVGGLANVVSSSKTLEDVTLTYSDTENHVKALETERDRLLELMAQAETMADLLEIESRLTEVRYELEQYASRLKLYDNQIDYATIYLEISEVQEYTPVEEPTVWQRIRTGFVSSLKGLGTGLVDVGVWLIVSSPYLLVFGGIGVGVFLLIRRRIRKSPKKPTE